MLFDNDNKQGGEVLTILEIMGWIVAAIMMFIGFVRLLELLGFTIGGCN